MIVSKELDYDLWIREKSICFCVHNEKYYWILDYRYNLTLNVEKEYRALLNMGDITEEQFFSACQIFRGGVLNLDETNFLKYLETETVQQCTMQELRDLLQHNNYPSNISLLDRMEKFYLDGNDLTTEDFKASNELASRLPLFYINFDRKIYLHMDWQRRHEDLAYSDWLAQAGDFNYLVPDKEKYWVQDNRDFWKLRYLQGD